jgi:hypothetical protein
MIPTPAGSAPRWEAKRGRTGLLEMVELKIAAIPAPQSKRKGLTFMVFDQSLDLPVISQIAT